MNTRTASPPAVVITPRGLTAGDAPLLAPLRQAGCRLVYQQRTTPYTAAELAAMTAEANPVALVVGIDPVPESVLAAAPGLKLLAKYGVGLDNVDLQAARARGIRVTWTPAANSESVADLAFALMLAAARWVPLHDSRLRAGEAVRRVGREVFGKTLGLIGVGRVGQGMARRAAGFKMPVLAVDPMVPAAEAAAWGVALCTLDQLLARSDVISVHCPLTPQTLNLLGESQLQQMRPGSILVNTARAEVVDPEALTRALSRGPLHAAALDVFDGQSGPWRRLLELENCIGSPHAGASTVEAMTRMGRQVVQEVMRLLGGEPPEYPAAGT